MAEEETEGSKQKGKVSRRGFLKTAVAGTAGAGFAVTVPRILTGEMGPLSGLFNGTTAGAGEAPIVAYVSDASKGEIVLMAGTREVRIRDFGMVSWLVRAVAGA